MSTVQRGTYAFFMNRASVDLASSKNDPWPRGADTTHSAQERKCTTSSTTGDSGRDDVGTLVQELTTVCELDGAAEEIDPPPQERQEPLRGFADVWPLPRSHPFAKRLMIWSIYNTAASQHS